MKALSIKQPWADRIILGQKTIETRYWPTKHRGKLLIVSSKLPKAEWAGCALGVVDLVDCRKMTPQDEAAAMCECLPGLYAWVFENVVAIAAPFPVRGRLRLYDVELPSGSRLITLGGNDSTAERQERLL